MLKWRAMDLRVQGYTLREITQRLQAEFELVEPVAVSTIDVWLDEAYAEAFTAKQTDATRHCATLLARSERILTKLLPMATGDFVVQRYVKVDGLEVPVICEKEMDERLKVVAEVRKQMEFQLKLVRGGRDGNGEQGENASGHNLTMIIERTVTNNIIMPGQEPKKDTMVSLLLASGSDDVDKMDASALPII